MIGAATDNNMQVFISYSRDDREKALRLYEALQKNKTITPWIDCINILVGQDWEIEISRAIENSRYILLLLSNNSVNKVGFVQREMLKVIEKMSYFPPGERFILPIRLDDCQPRHEAIQRLNWIDLFPDWERETNTLVSQILSVSSPISQSLASPAAGVSNTKVNLAGKLINEHSSSVTTVGSVVFSGPWILFGLTWYFFDRVISAYNKFFNDIGLQFPIEHPIVFGVMCVFSIAMPGQLIFDRVATSQSKKLRRKLQSLNLNEQERYSALLLVKENQLRDEVEGWLLHDA